MVKWIVAGKPRMALFAGDDGIMTGEELTYDYNFEYVDQQFHYEHKLILGQSILAEECPNMSLWSSYLQRIPRSQA